MLHRLLHAFPQCLFACFTLHSALCHQTNENIKTVPCLYWSLSQPGTNYYLKRRYFWLATYQYQGLLICRIWCQPTHSWGRFHFLWPRNGYRLFTNTVGLETREYLGSPWTSCVLSVLWTLIDFSGLLSSQNVCAELIFVLFTIPCVKGRNWIMPIYSASVYWGIHLTS